jgi:hypothetical protein
MIGATNADDAPFHAPVSVVFLCILLLALEIGFDE